MFSQFLHAQLCTKYRGAGSPSILQTIHVVHVPAQGDLDQSKKKQKNNRKKKNDRVAKNGFGCTRQLSEARLYWATTKTYNLFRDTSMVNSVNSQWWSTVLEPTTNALTSTSAI